MENLNRTLSMKLLIVGGLIFADDGLADVINPGTIIRDGIITSKKQVESTTSYVFTFNNSQSITTKTLNSI